jgi:type IV fimbrial biogenesis protein FimT
MTRKIVMSISRIKQSAGLTLVELMVGLLLASVIVAVAIPSFRGLLGRVEVATQASRFVGALNLARSEAIKGIPGLMTTTRVVVCKSNGATTTPDCDESTCLSSGDHCWEKGWIVFRDPNANGKLNDGTDQNYCGSSRDCRLSIFPAMPPKITLRTGGTIQKWIGYEPDGSAVSDQGLPNDTFRLCIDEDKTTGRFIVINSAGRARVDKGSSTEKRSCT